VLTTAGGIACYGTLEGYLKCVDANRHQQGLFKFKTPSGIIGNVFTYEHKASNTSAYFRESAAGPVSAWQPGSIRKRHRRSGAVGGYKELRDYTELGGSLTVFALP
jgi:hypothetical protein